MQRQSDFLDFDSLGAGHQRVDEAKSVLGRHLNASEQTRFQRQHFDLDFYVGPAIQITEGVYIIYIVIYYIIYLVIYYSCKSAL